MLEQLDRERGSLGPKLPQQGLEHRNEGVGFFERKELHEQSLRRQSVTFARFVVVAGLSGAGKSQAMKSFEDLGFYCIDNLPPALALELVQLARAAGVERLALSLEMRTHGPFGEALAALERFKENGIDYDLLFLEADDDVLIRRYSETRRRHPLDGSGALRDSIASERRALAPLRAAATRTLDTSHLAPADLKSNIALTYGNQPKVPLGVHVVAFGFKYGVPLDADLVFDVRFLENPYYVPELKSCSGLERPVVDFLEARPQTHEFLRHLESFLDFLMPLYIAEGKARLTIALGCTGGRHRSVYIAETIGAHLRKIEGLTVTVEHRELVSA